MQLQPSGLTLVQRLQVIKDRDQRHSLAQISENYDFAQLVVANVLNSRAHLEQIQVKSAIRNIYHWVIS